MRIAICDDERAMQEELKAQLLAIDPRQEITLFDSARDLLPAAGDYALIFLDIQMPELSGLQAAREMRERCGDGPVLIFVTGAKEYALEAFDVDALHYLIKPIEPEKLKEAYIRAVQAIERKRSEDSAELFIHTKQDHVRILKSEVLYAESQLRKGVLHTAGGVVELYATMEELTELLGDGFFRCHRSYIVNLSKIVRYGNEDLYLTNGERINLSRHRYAEFVKVYMRYLKAGGIGFVE